MDSKKLERLIMDYLDTGDFAMPSILDYVRGKNDSFYESSIRQGVWRMVDRGEIEFTSDRAFRKVLGYS